MIESIALNMVTYNEAHRIKQTLDLAAPHVNEVVIVDQDSTDRTIFEIAEWFEENPMIRGRLVADKHHGYCEPSRIKAWEQTQSPWILVLDADERISDEFASDMRSLESRGFRGARLKRSLYVGGEHKWTGDYQYRFFKRDNVKFLDELHTEPQPYRCSGERMFIADYIGIIHTKSWSEQIRDERAYDQLIRKNSDSNADAKLALNVYSKILEDAGVTPYEADMMTPEQRAAKGII